MGDRHPENLLLDTRTGDLVHVDFNCLFEKARRYLISSEEHQLTYDYVKGKTLATPERVPFRLTQNVVDGFGVTGIEGVFRIACELAMQTLRDNKECLMIILDAFIHDPLVEWQDMKKNKDLQDRRGHQKMDGNAVKADIDLKSLARNALSGISKKLQGMYSISHEKLSDREIPASSLVEMLITESTDLRNLVSISPSRFVHAVSDDCSRARCTRVGAHIFEAHAPSAYHRNIVVSTDRTIPRTMYS